VAKKSAEEQIKVLESKKAKTVKEATKIAAEAQTLDTAIAQLHRRQK